MKQPDLDFVMLLFVFLYIHVRQGKIYINSSLNYSFDNLRKIKTFEEHGGSTGERQRCAGHKSVDR